MYFFRIDRKSRQSRFIQRSENKTSIIYIKLFVNVYFTILAPKNQLKQNKYARSKTGIET